MNFGARLFEAGNPNPEYATLGTVNWMRALAILLADSNMASEVDALAESGSWPRRASADQLEALERLYLARSYRTSSAELAGTQQPERVVRLAIMSWYYCVYFSAQAMVAAVGEKAPETHAKTARVWLAQLISNPKDALVPYPFNLFLRSMKADDVAALTVSGRKTGYRLHRRPADGDHGFPGRSAG